MVAFPILILPQIGMFLILAQHRVDQPGQLLRRRRNRLGLIHVRAHQPEVGVQRAAA